jgi:autotransporter-associated beta strand protein
MMVAFVGVQTGLADPPVVVGGNHQLDPDTADQQINVNITGGDLVAGWQPRIQLGDGTTGPLFTDFEEVVGTIFSGANLVAVDFVPGGSTEGRFISGSVGSLPPNPVAANGLLISLTVDTTGVQSGRYGIFFEDVTFPTGGTFSSEILAENGTPIAAAQFMAGSIAVGANPVMTWIGGGGDGNWNTGPNWNGLVAPQAGDTLVFSGITNVNTNNNLVAGTNFHGITFADSAGGFILSGNAIVLDANTAITNNSINAQTINLAVSSSSPMTFDAAAGDLVFNNPVTVNAPGPLTVTGPNNVTITGAIGGTGGVTKNGDGIFITSAVNTFTGDLTLNAGTLQIDAGAGLDENVQVNFNGGKIHNNTGGIVELENDIALGGDVQIDSGNNEFEFSGLINLGGGDHTVTLVNNGNDAETVFSDVISNGSITFAGVNGDEVLVLEGASTHANTTTQDIWVGIVNDQAFGTGGWTVAGPTVVAAVDAARNVANSINLNADLTIIDDSDAPQNLTLSGPIAVGANNVTLSHQATGNTAITNTIALGANNLNIDAAQDLGLAAAISGTGSLTKLGAGDLTLSGVNTYSGGTTVSTGTLIGDTGSLQGAITNNAAVVFDQAADGTYAGDMSGTGALTKQGTGNVTLGGVNTYSGGTTVSAGTLTGDTDSLQGGITNNATVVFDQAADGAYAGDMNGTGALTKQGAGNVTLSGVNTHSGGTTVSAGTLTGDTDSLQGAIVNNAAVVFDQAGAGTYAGDMSGTGALTKQGAGDLTVSGTNTHSGGTTVSAGTLTGDTDSLQGPITNNAAVVFDQAADGTYGGAISGTGTVSKQGAGNLTLSGANTYSGITSLDAGALNLTGSLAGSLDVNSGTTLTGAGTVGDGDDTLNVNDATVNIGNSLGTLTVNGDANFDATSILGVEVQAVTFQSDLLDVSGIALFTNGATFDVSQFGVGEFVEADTFNIVTAGGGFGATDINQLNVNSNIAGINFDLNILGNNLQLLVAPGIRWDSGGADGNWSTAANWDNEPTGVGLDVLQNVLIFDGPGETATADEGDYTNLGGLKFNNTAGAFTLDGGQLSFIDTAIVVNNSANPQTIDNNLVAGATGLTLNAAGGDFDINGNIDLSAGGILSVTGGNTTTIDGVISNDSAGSVVKSGAGTLNLTNDNTYTGDTTVSAGTLNLTGSVDGDVFVDGGALMLGNDNAIDAARTLNINGGALQSDDDARNVGNAVNVGGDFALTGDSDLELSGGVDLGAAVRAVDVGAGLDLTLSGIITNGGLTKNGDGTLNLTGDSAYTGDTTLNTGTLNLAGSVDSDVVVAGGTLILGSDNAIDGGSALNVNGGAIQSDNDARNVANAVNVGGDFTVGGANNLQLSGGIDLGGATRQVTVDNTADTLLSGTLTNGGLTKAGSGTLELSGTNDFIGPLNVNAGTVELTNGSAVDDTVAVTVADAATLMLNNGEQIGSLTGTAGAAVDLNATTLTVGDANDTQFAGVIAGGNGDLTKVGGGSLELSGANTYTGVTIVQAGTLNLTGSVTSNVTVSGGTLNLGNNNAIDAANTLMVNVGALSSDDDARNVGNEVTVGGDFSITGNNLELSGPVALGGADRAVTVENTTNLSGVISGTGGLTKQGAGTLELSGDNTYAGDTTLQTGTLNLTGSVDGDVTVDGGILVLGGDNIIDAAQSLNVNGGTLQSNDDARHIANAVNIGGDFTIDGNNLQLSGPVNIDATTRHLDVVNTTVISGNVASAGGGLTKAGAGTLELSGTNTYAGTTTVSDGTLELTGGSAIIDTGEVDLDTSGAMLQLNNDETIGALAGVAGTTVDLQSNELTVAGDGTDTTYAGVIANNGDGRLTKAGTGSLELSGANTYAGVTTISGGTLELTGGNAIADGNAVDVNNAAGTLRLNDDETIGSLTGVDDSTVDLGGSTLTVGDANNATFAGDMIDDADGSLTKVGTGTLELSGTNTFTGPTAVNQGTLALTGGQALDDTTAVTIADAATLQLNDSERIGSLAGVAGAMIDLDVNTLTLGDASDTEFAGDITGGVTGNMTKIGAGTLILSGANTYAGQTTISAGTLAVRDGSAIADTGAVNLDTTGATFRLDDDETIGSLIGVAGTNVNMGGFMLTVGDALDTTFAGNIAGAGGQLTKVGSGTLELSGANTHTGVTTISGGAIALTGGSAISDAGRVELGIAGTTLMLNDSERIGSLVGIAGTSVNLGANTLTTGDDTDTVFAGAISGTGVLTKEGTGTFELAGANTYTGATNVNAGMFTLTGSLAGLVNVNGGVFDGDGTIGGDLNGLGGRIRPGNSIGTITVGGNFSLDVGARLEVEINTDNPPDADLLDVAGDATLASGSIIQVTPVGTADLVEGSLFTIIDTNGGVVTDNGAIFDAPAIAELIGEITNGLYQIRIVNLRDFIEATANSVNPGIGVALETVADAADAGDPAAQALIDLLDDLNEDELNQFVEQVNNGVRTPSISSDTITDIVQAFSQSLTNYMASRRQGMPTLTLHEPSRSMRGEPYGSPLLASSELSPALLHYAIAAMMDDDDDAPDAQEPRAVEPASAPWSFFVRTYGIFSDRDTTAGRTGYESDGFGFQAGADYRIDERWLVGLVAGYTNTSADLKQGLGELDIDSIRVGPFVSYDSGDNWFIDAALTYGHHNHDSVRRTTATGTAAADYDGYDITAYVGGGYELRKDDLIITPTASLQYTYFNRDAYTETGVGGLTVAEHETSTLHSRLGVRSALPIERARMTLVPEGLIGWEHEFLDDADDVEATFPGDGAFTVDTTGPESDSVFFGAGLSAIFNARTTAYIRYEGSANGNGNTHSVGGGVQFSF